MPRPATSPMTSSSGRPAGRARRTSRRRLRPGAGRPVARGRRDARQVGQRGGQQAALQLLRDVVLALEEADALDRQRGPVGRQLEQRDVVAREAAGEQRPDVQRADRAPLDDQRHAQHRRDGFAERMGGARPSAATSTTAAGRPPRRRARSDRPARPSSGASATRRRPRRPPGRRPRRPRPRAGAPRRRRRRARRRSARAARGPACRTRASRARRRSRAAPPAAAGRPARPARGRPARG